jgi:hypothetical protein
MGVKGGHKPCARAFFFFFELFSLLEKKSERGIRLDPASHELPLSLPNGQLDQIDDKLALFNIQTSASGAPRQALLATTECIAARPPLPYVEWKLRERPSQVILLPERSLTPMRSQRLLL